MNGLSKSSAVSPFWVLNYDYSRWVSNEAPEQPKALIVPPEIVNKRKQQDKPHHKRSVSDTIPNSMLFKP